MEKRRRQEPLTPVKLNYRRGHLVPVKCNKKA